MTVMNWDELTRDELSGVLGSAVVVFPTGATEQHGPHLPTGHDTISVTNIAREAALRVTSDIDVVILPTLPFGSSTHHVPFGGTLTLQSETYFSVVRQVVISVLDAGGSRILILNGHGGNHEINQLVARDVVLEFQSMGQSVTIAASSYWDLARHFIERIPEWNDLRIPGHAGQFETSTMLVHRPSLVRQPIDVRTIDPSPERDLPGLRTETGFSWQRYDGFTDFPHRATQDVGEKLLEIIEQSVATAIDAVANSGETHARSKGFRRWGEVQPPG